MNGGIGNDVYVIDDALDLVQGEVVGGGRDKIVSSTFGIMTLVDAGSGSATSPINIEDLSYLGTSGAILTGNTLDNILEAPSASGATIDGRDGNDLIRGSEEADTLLGGDGKDQIFGAGGDDLIDGGFREDAMAGGKGNDVYLVDASGDTVAEAAGQGYDTVRAWVNVTLAANVERGELQQSTGGKLIGNGLDNALYGSKEGPNDLFGQGGNDKLVGAGSADRLFGGAGEDAMYGGGGDDLYWVDNAKDRAFEFQGGGTDGILTTLASVSLSDLMSGHVENLQGLGASTKFSLTGNGLDNQIAGDAGHDVLKGLSGKDKLVGNAGDDRMEGGTGDDILVGGTGYDFFVFAKGWGSIGPRTSSTASTG